MDLDDLEREIIKVTQQGGIARVPEVTALEAMSSEEDGEQRSEMQEWIVVLCAENRLKHDHDKDMFGLMELLFFHEMNHPASNEG